MNRLKLPQTPEAIRRRHNAEATAGLIGVLALVGCEAMDQPEYSDQTQTVTVVNGEGLSSAVQHIDGIENVDYRDAIKLVEGLDANRDVLSDGLQHGEMIEIPVSVSK